MVVRLAVGSSVALKEVARSQLLVALLASEVLRVPGLAQRRDHLAYEFVIEHFEGEIAFLAPTLHDFQPKFQLDNYF